MPVEPMELRLSRGDIAEDWAFDSYTNTAAKAAWVDDRSNQGQEMPAMSRDTAVSLDDDESFRWPGPDYLEDVSTLPEGRAIVRIPARLSGFSYELLEAFFASVLKKAWHSVPDDEKSRVAAEEKARVTAMIGSVRLSGRDA